MNDSRNNAGPIQGEPEVSWRTTSKEALKNRQNREQQQKDHMHKLMRACQSGAGVYWNSSQ